nr:MAG: recombination, repair and ssDNA binding protein [Bacteriophage sp.]UWF90010.1 MAG: Recombination, repair and ssDNA binding protein UvsY [Bacteriophage sp.]
MKTELKKLKVKFEGRTLEIDIQKELSINENIINSQLRESPSSYYILCSLRDKYIKERDLLAREKDEAYSNAWVYYKDANERWNNEYVSHKANLNKKYSSIYERYLKAVEKANKFIAICKAYESRENILRTINANLRKGG